MSSPETYLADGEEEELEIAAPEDFEVQRDEDGEIVPVRQRIPGTDQAILVRPMPPGAFNRWLDVLTGQDESTENQARVLSEWVVEPQSWANADVEYIEQNLKGGVIGGILKAIRNSAGYEVFRAAREEDLAEASTLMGQMGEDTMADLIRDFADSDEDSDTP